jgi:hypothetical protein
MPYCMLAAETDVQDRRGTFVIDDVALGPWWRWSARQLAQLDQDNLRHRHWSITNRCHFRDAQCAVGVERNPRTKLSPDKRAQN